METLMVSPAGGKEKNSEKSSAGRLEPFTQERFQELKQKLNLRIKRINALIKVMDEKGLTAPVKVDGYTMMDSGIDRLDDFLDHASKAIRKEGKKS